MFGKECLVIIYRLGIEMYVEQYYQWWRITFYVFYLLKVKYKLKDNIIKFV